MTRKHTQLMITILAGFFLIALLILSATATPVDHAYAGVPTPVSIMNQSDQAALVTFLDANTSTTDGGGPGLQLYTYEYCNLQYIIDQGPGVPNTTTLRVEWSMDNTNWAVGPNIVASNAADAVDLVQVPNLGRYQRIYEDHTGAEPITVTVKAVCK